MTTCIFRSTALGALTLAAAAVASAHVTLPPGGAAAGSEYAAGFRVGHACAGAASTTGLRVRLPDGFTFAGAEPRPGWTLVAGPQEVTWTAASPQAVLPAAERASFVVRGRLTERPGPLWFKVLQRCDQGEADWAEVPATADAPAGKFPAARLDVLPAGVAAVDVQAAWARPTVPGQAGAGVFARLTAASGARLVGASTPVAATAEVHEMRMEGDVMRMRAVAGGLDLPPGQAVELGPGGFHLMLTRLNRPLALGDSFPVTLSFVDRRGVPGERRVQVQVTAGPVGAPAGHAH